MSLRTLSAGAQLGKCTVGVLIGRGGMGSVYRGWHRTLQVDVAIKVIGGNQTPQEDTELRRRFLREARAAARLRHENLVQVLDVDEHEGSLYMVTEYVDGGSVAQRLRLGPLPWKEAARIGAEVAEGLAIAHEAGIVHRDIKPANLLLTHAGVVKVADFGLAAWRQDEREITRHGQLLGTPYYMAPEQIECREVSGRTDLYALGATLFHAVTGQVPFPGDASLQICMRHLTDPVPSLRASCKELPPAFEALIRWLMEKSPTNRPASASEVAAHLERLAGGDTSMPERPARVPVSPSPPQPRALPPAPPSSLPPFLAAQSRATPGGTKPWRPGRWAILAAASVVVVAMLGLRAGGLLRFDAGDERSADRRAAEPPASPPRAAHLHSADEAGPLGDQPRTRAAEASSRGAAGEARLHLVGRPVPSGTTHLAVRDLDGDGCADIATCGAAFSLFRGSIRGLMGQSRLGNLDADRYARLLGVVNVESPDVPILVLEPKPGPETRHVLDLVRPYLEIGHLLLATRTVTTTKASFPVGAARVLSADLDGDGVRELAFWSDGLRTLDLWYGGPSFPPSARTRRTLAGKVLAVAVASRAGAGRADLLLVLTERASPGRGEPTTLVQAIGGPRARLRQTTVAQGRWDWPRLACGDWSGDQRTDLLTNAAAHSAPREHLAPFRSTRAGAFEEVAAAPPVEAHPALPWPCLADLDQDARADVVLLARRGDLATLHTLRSKGDGSFQTMWRARLHGVEVLSQITTGDLDGNGSADLVLFDRPNKRVLAVYGDGRGGFQLRPE